MVRGRLMSRVKERFEMYLCYHGDRLLYIGSGALYRHKHCNSGTSHVYELNKLHFEGVKFDVKVKYFETKEEALEEEQRMIKQHLPELNTVFTTRNMDKSKWVQKYAKVRKSFARNNKFDVKSVNHVKMNEFLDDFLELHPLPLIATEGVLLRGRSYYKSRGCSKFENLVKNTRTVRNSTFINLFSILKISLEEVFERPIEFAWFKEGVSFKDELLTMDEMFGTFDK